MVPAEFRGLRRRPVRAFEDAFRFGDELPDAVEFGLGGGDDYELVIAIDPGRFAGGATLESQVDAVIADLRTQGEILFPGEPELNAEKERRLSGIPIDTEALKDMNAWSRKLGVAPLTEAA